MLPISLPLGDVQALANLAERGAEIQIDLSAQRLTSGDLDLAFAIAPLRKEGLLLGLDELGLIERRRTALDRFEQDDRVSRPWVYL